MCTLNGSVNSDMFLDCIRGSLIPNRQQFDGTARSVVIMDNCSIHHDPEVEEQCREAGSVVFLLPPIHPTSIQLRNYLAAAVDDPIPIIQAAFDDITPSKCEAWITHAGYNL